MPELNLSNGLEYSLKPFTPIAGRMPAQKMVTVSVRGDPNEETARVAPPLYATAYAIRKLFKEDGSVFKVEKLRGRWPGKNAEKVKSDWAGTYGLPVPNTVEALPPIKAEKQVEGVEVKLTEWAYGDVVQIVHVGPYAEEPKTIEMLRDFVEAQGCELVPDSHEEIYLTDPTKTPTGKMKTLLLYRTRKRR